MKKVHGRKFVVQTIHNIKAHHTDILLGMIPVVLLSLYFLLFRFNSITAHQIDSLQFASHLSMNSISSYPVMKNVYDPFITAQGALILDDDSQVILYSKNPTLRFSTASTTKIMTALVALEHYKPDDVLTTYSDNIEPVTVGFTKGEQAYFQDVLYGMLVPSGNDAAYMVADNYPGGIQAFVNRMNQKARELHLYSTHYADPAGLNDDGNYTSALDLARLASIALRNKTFAEVVDTKYKVITALDGRSFVLNTSNKLLGYDGIDGVKTGYTQAAGEVLVTSKVDHGRRFLIVVIKSKDRFSDTLTLLNYLSDNVAYNTFSYQ